MPPAAAAWSFRSSSRDGVWSLSRRTRSASTRASSGASRPRESCSAAVESGASRRISCAGSFINIEVRSLRRFDGLVAPLLTS